LENDELNTVMPEKLIPVGTRFARLVVLRRGVVRIRPNGSKLFSSDCLCDCGKEVTVLNTYLFQGATKSCGCLQSEWQKTGKIQHGCTGTRTHRIWCAMRERCYDPKRASYPYYGAIGVTVCDRWKNSFEEFLKDMGECPPRLEIDRWPNKTGNYEPGNCRWATRKQQVRNTKRNIILTVNGITGCLVELCEKFNVPYKRTRFRLLNKWPLDKAFFEPQRKNQFV
jgi:hypothetical protein